MPLPLGWVTKRHLHVCCPIKVIPKRGAKIIFKKSGAIRHGEQMQQPQVIVGFQPILLPLVSPALPSLHG